MKYGTKIGIIYGVLGFPVPFKGGPLPLVFLLLAIVREYIHIDPRILKATVTVFNPVFGLHKYYNFEYIPYYGWLLVLVPVLTSIAIACILNCRQYQMLRCGVSLCTTSN